MFSLSVSQAERGTGPPPPPATAGSAPLFHVVSSPEHKIRLNTGAEMTSASRNHQSTLGHASAVGSLASLSLSQLVAKPTAVCLTDISGEAPCSLVP